MRSGKGNKTLNRTVNRHKTCPLQLTLPKFAGTRGRATPSRSWRTARVQDLQRLNLSYLVLTELMVLKRCAFGDKMWQVSATWNSLRNGWNAVPHALSSLLSEWKPWKRQSQSASICDLWVGPVGTSEGWEAMYIYCIRQMQTWCMIGYEQKEPLSLVAS